MSIIHRTAIVQHRAEEMFRVVQDIAKYPEFLPWCEKAEILKEEGETVIAKLEIRKGPVHLSYTTRNIHHLHEWVDVKLYEGPFKHLQGRWHFANLQYGSKVTFDLNFELSNKLLNFTAGPVIQTMANTLVDVFIKRANHLYLYTLRS